MYIENRVNINSQKDILQPDKLTSTDVSFQNNVGRLSNKQIKIPVYSELLSNLSSYEETIILNQILYYSDKTANTQGLSIYDIKNLSLWDKSNQTLRKKLHSLEKKGYIEKINNHLYGVNYYKPKKSLYIHDNELVSLVESTDLPYGDYFTAAILNMFRQHLLSGNESIKLSMQEIVNNLKLDRSRTAVKNRLNELIRLKIIKPYLTGRIYTYELNKNAILHTKTPEILQEQAKTLEHIFILHLEYINKYNKQKKVNFQRMLFDGYAYEDIQHIIAFLGFNSHWQNIITNPSLLRKHYDELIELSYKSLSKRKASRHIYKLLNNLLEKPKHIEVLPSISIKEDNIDLSDSNLWNIALMWCQANKKLLMSIYNKYQNMNCILDDEDIYNAMIQVIFNHLKKIGSTVVDITSSYIDKHIKGLMFAHYTKESELPSEDIISDENHHITINTDYSIFNLNNIPEQLEHIPYNDLKIIFDYLGADGKVHTQRELSKKYNMSLGSISNLLSKRIKEICNIYKLPPPDRFKNKNKNQKDNK